MQHEEFFFSLLLSLLLFEIVFPLFVIHNVLPAFISTDTCYEYSVMLDTVIGHYLIQSKAYTGYVLISLVFFMMYHYRFRVLEYLIKPWEQT